MAFKYSKRRAQTYNMLTDVQKNILKRYYDGGMVGTGRQYDEIITRVAEETGLRKNKVEVSLHWSFFPNSVIRANLHSWLTTRARNRRYSVRTSRIPMRKRVRTSTFECIFGTEISKSIS